MRGGLVSTIVVSALFVVLPAGAEAAPACTITGSAKADVLRGTDRADVICAGKGADEVFGRGGDDIVRGGGGSDDLVGGRGADRLIGGAGRDSCRDSQATTYLRGCEQHPRARARPRPPFRGPGCCSVSPVPLDLTAPEVVAVSFNKPYVDTSSENSIGLWIEAGDHEAGVGQVEVELEGPTGAWRKLNFESDVPYAGASADVEVPASTPAGRYRVSSLSLSDRAGNKTSFDATELHEAGFDAAFDVFEGPDVEGPELTDYSFTPHTLDTSSDPGEVKFSLEARDDLSGVADAAALILLPGSSGPVCFPCGHRAPSNLASGTIYDGTWQEDLPLPRFAMPGTYKIIAVVLYDRAKNRTTYNREELEGLGYPLEFTQTGSGDTEPPEVVDFWMNPGTLPSASGSRAIQFFIHVKDDLSGVGETAESVFGGLRVDIHPPLAFDWWYTDGGMTRVSGNDLDGVWRFEKILPADAETGTWTIPAIEATDRAGNETLLQGDALKATGWDLTFENLP